MTFNSHKRSDAQSDVIEHGSPAAALRAFDQTLLFQTAMIHFDPPGGFGFSFPLSFGHFPQAGRPVFRCAVRGANPKHFDFSKTFEPQKRSVTAGQTCFGDGLQTALPDSDLPVGFEPRQKMPAQSATQFQVLNRPIPTVAHIQTAD